MRGNYRMACGLAGLLPFAAIAAVLSLEWNPTYPVDVPWEVELSPSKLSALAGVQEGSGFAVTAKTAAGAKKLRVVAIEGRVPGTVALRFNVPPGTAALSCEAGVGKLKMTATDHLDNLFDGALAPSAAGGWKLTNGGKAAALPEGGVTLSAVRAGGVKATYAVDVPERLAGQPVFIEIDIENIARLTSGSPICIDQLDAAGKVLSEALSDPRWLSHMRPVGKLQRLREEGRIHPKARKLLLTIAMRDISGGVDEYGLPVKAPSDLWPALKITKLAVRPAARLPFPKYDDSFFARGVTGAAGDFAFNFQGEHAIWYQTRSWASWAQGAQLRKEEQLFFPSAAGTVEAWFKAESLPKTGTLTLFQASHHQAKVARGSSYKEARGSVCAVLWNAARKSFSFTLKDSDDKVFEKAVPAELPVGRWFHVAAAWTPGGEAKLFLDGRSILSFPVADYRPYDLVNAECPNDYHCTEFYFGCNHGSTRARGVISPRPELPHFPGAGDLLRVSTGARYSADFTPARTLAPDADTRALFRFDRSFDGVSGGGVGWIPGTVLAKTSRVDRRLDVGGRTVQYYPAEILPENDPDKVLNCLNYPVMPTAAEFRAARRSRTATATLAPGGTMNVDVGAKAVYTDFIEYANISDEPLTHPLLVNSGEIDPRSFGDISDSLGASGLADRERANAVFNFVLGASDYFMSHQSICDAWSDVPRSVEYEALIMLNSYCGFECGPLNNLAANMFACSGQCPASQTGGYGHSFEEVFYDGKNHIYDLSAQKFFPAMDNETAAYLAEDENEPGIHNRLGKDAHSFIRNGTRAHRVQTPAFQPKVAMSLNPGERFKVWFANDGTVNDVQHNSRYCGNRRVDFHIAQRVKRGREPYKEFQYECSKETGLAPCKADDVHVIDNFFPHYGNGFLTFAGAPTAANPAFTEIKADSFCYLVQSCYPVVAGEYAAVAKNGRPVALEISTDRKAFDHVGTGKAVVDYRIRSRNAFLVRVKAPIADIASFTVSTEVIVNPRILPGKLRPGANTLTLKATKGKPARVTVGWREPVKEITVAGGIYTGAIPGSERQVVLLDPAKPLALAVTGASPAATVRTYEGLEATLAGGRLSIRAGRAADPSLAALDIVDGDAVKQLTVLVSSNARLLLPGAAKLTGQGVRLMAADGDSVQDRLLFSKADESVAHFDFAALPAGDYALLTAVRCMSHPEDLHASPLFAKFKGMPAFGCAQPANDATCFYKAHYGQKGSRANWHWDFPNEPLSEYPYHLMRFFPLKDAQGLDYGLSDTGSGAVEMAGAIVLPAPNRAFKRQLMKVLCGLNCDPWLVRGAMPSPERFTLDHPGNK